MTTCDIAIPIRSPDPKWYQESVATCMRCGERYKSHTRRAGLIEQTCGCGMVYRVETLSVDAIACDKEIASANEASFTGQSIHL
jgi:hypothetical protein